MEVRELLVLGLLVGLGCTVASAPLAGKAACQRMEFAAPAGSWVPQATWSHGWQHLLTANIGTGRIEFYDHQGELESTYADPGRGALEFRHPVGIFRHPEGYALQEGGHKIIWLDREFEPQRALSFKERALAPGLKTVVPTRIAMFRDQFVGAFQVEDSAGEWSPVWGGFAGHPLDLEVIQPLRFDSPGWDILLVSSNAIAQTENEVWGLVFGEPSRLVRLAPTIRRLKAFPAGFETLPRLPESRGPSSSVVRYRALEMATTPVSLYGHEESPLLFVLTRQPRTADGNSGGTLWQLTAVDPEADRVSHTVTLPTTAPHVILAPGPREWAVLEKGRVTGSGQQEISTFLLVPSQWIENPDNKTLQGDDLPACQ